MSGRTPATALMLRRIEQTIRERKLVHRGMHVVAAVSGGADSIALLFMLAQLRSRLGIRVSAFHLNHSLRGKASDRDAAFVARLCSGMKIPCVVEKADVAGKHLRPGVSLEMAAREARLDAYRSILKKASAHAVAVAHHADDQAETVFMRLLAGSGLDGLEGMAYCSEPLPGLSVIRPMLDVRRGEILSYLRTNKIVWREDRSNRDLSIKRNAIRHLILPYVRDHGFPGADEALIRFAQIIRGENELIKTRMARLLLRLKKPKGGHLHRDLLMECPVADQRRILRAWLDEAGLLARDVDFAWIEDLRRGIIDQTRGSRQLNARHLISWRQGTIMIVSEQVPDMRLPVEVTVPGTTLLPDYGIRITFSPAKGYEEISSTIGVYPAIAYIRRANDHKKSGIFIMRSRLPGDCIRPTGMKGTVKIKDLFINTKYPADQRAGYPLLVSGDSVVWVPGYRVDRDWAVPGSRAASWRITVRRMAKKP